jgi:hypothetical protein
MRAPCAPHRDGRNKSGHDKGQTRPTNKKAGDVAGLETHSLCSREEKFLGPDLLQTPGGWGLRNPVLEGRPGPEVTVPCVSFQLGTRLFEIGQQYDVIEESVRPPNPPKRASIAVMALISILPLAGALVRRNHLSNYGHT